ncbi:MAG: BrnA antitoxin family protein [Gemmatimonadaceae bacterium]|nr:BrnA antitoxin family protein [Gemmatimonadaceae bacterium]
MTSWIACWLSSGPPALGRSDSFRRAGQQLESAASTPRTLMRKEYDFSKARRGPVLPVATGKTRITIRLDDDILDWYRAQVDAAGGGNYQTLINQTLRQAMTEAREPLEAVVRRVIRDELGSRPAARPRRKRAGAA